MIKKTILILMLLTLTSINLVLFSKYFLVNNENKLIIQELKTENSYNKILNEKLSKVEKDIYNLNYKLEELDNNLAESQLNVTNPKQAGVYIDKTKQIRIHTSRISSLNNLNYVANHEIGHYIWFNELELDVKDKYSLIYDNATEFISEYSKKNVLENYAEEYENAMECKFNISKISENKQFAFRGITQ
jgi:hypothetical protein